VDYGILVTPKQEDEDKELEFMKSNFNISVEGTLSEYVGVSIERSEDGKIHMTQPNIIRSIHNDLNFNEGTKAVQIPEYSTTILKDGKKNPKHAADWRYRSVMGKLNFLSLSCQPEIACAVHQPARFSADPRTNHIESVK
jgi:hypothetical protein